MKMLSAFNVGKKYSHSLELYDMLLNMKKGKKIIMATPKGNRLIQCLDDDYKLKNGSSITYQDKE